MLNMPKIIQKGQKKDRLLLKCYFRQHLTPYIPFSYTNGLQFTQSFILITYFLIDPIHTIAYESGEISVARKDATT